jgi:hypothetical protein
MKLSVQLIIVMFAALIVGVTVFGYFSFSYTQDALIEVIGREQQALADEVMGLIDRTLYHKYQEIQVIADASPIENVFVTGTFTKDGEQRLKELLLQTGPWDSLALFAADGYEFSHIENNGETIYTHNTEEQNAFMYALEGEVYISDLVLSEDGRPTIIFAAPSRDKNHPESPVIGVVIGKFSWPVILEILDNALTEDRHIHLFNKDGMTIGTPTWHKDEILEHDLRYIPVVQEALEGKCSSSSSSSSFITEDPHVEGDAHEQTKHIPALSSCALQQGYLGFRSKGWGLIIETPEDILLQPVQELIYTFLIVGFLVIMLFIPVVLLLSKTITKPLERLTKSNKLISQGKFKEAQQQQQQQQQHIPDEIKVLTETRQIMLQGLVGKKELDATHKELEKKVKELERWEKFTVGRELRIKELKDEVKNLTERKYSRKKKAKK